MLSQFLSLQNNCKHVLNHGFNVKFKCTANVRKLTGSSECHWGNEAHFISDSIIRIRVTLIWFVNITTNNEKLNLLKKMCVLAAEISVENIWNTENTWSGSRNTISEEAESWNASYSGSTETYNQKPKPKSVTLSVDVKFKHWKTIQPVPVQSERVQRGTDDLFKVLSFVVPMAF